jgi:hypothetical protein
MNDSVTIEVIGDSPFVKIQYKLNQIDNADFFYYELDDNYPFCKKIQTDELKKGYVRLDIYNLSNTGSITGNIYVNDKLVETETSSDSYSDINLIYFF